MAAPVHRQVRARGGKQCVPECQRQRASTHLESAACTFIAPWSSRKLAQSVGSSCCLLYTGKHLPEQACNLSPPAHRTMEQPQACSISRSFMVAPVHMQAPAGACSRWQAVFTRVPASKCEHAPCVHLHIALCVCQTLARSVVASGWLLCKRKHQQVPARGGKHSSSEYKQQRASAHLEAACTSHRRAAASLLDQSDLHGGSGAQTSACSRWQAMRTRVPAAESKHAP